MAFEFNLKQNDTGPSMLATLLDETDTAYDLTGVTVTFNGTKPDGTAFTKSTTVTDAANGIVRVDWDAEDTTVAGVVTFEFELNNGETVPNDRSYQLKITPEVG